MHTRTRCSTANKRVPSKIRVLEALADHFLDTRTSWLHHHCVGGYEATPRVHRRPIGQDVTAAPDPYIAGLDTQPRSSEATDGYDTPRLDEYWGSDQL